jgi:ketosteroid isomerase-like protein
LRDNFMSGDGLVRTPILSTLLVGTVALAAAAAHAGGAAQADDVIAIERAALDRWGKGDPEGFLQTYAAEVTYFDPSRPRRVDGLATMRELYGPLAGKIKVDHYEMIGPKVQRHGDVAVLTYNLRSHGAGPDGKPAVTRWNSTSVYVRARGAWKVVHSHWSFTAPEG